MEGLCKERDLCKSMACVRRGTCRDIKLNADVKRRGQIETIARLRTRPAKRVYLRRTTG